MSSSTDAPGSDYEFEVSLAIPGASDSMLRDLHVTRFSAVEQISKPFLFDIEAQTQDASAADAGSPGGLLQCTATLTVTRGGVAEGSYSGIIISVTHLGSDVHEMQRYRFEMAPPIWLMSLNRRSRIFKEQSGADIISGLFTEYGVSGSVSAAQFVPETILQHQESDLDFLNRILTNYGLFYISKDASGASTIKVLSTNSDCGSPSDAIAVVINTARDEKNATFECREEIVVKQVAVSDYNPQDPTKPVTDVGDVKSLLKPRSVAAAATVIGSKGDSTVAYQDDAPGFPIGSTAQLTPGKLLASALAARQQSFSGRSTAPAMRAGSCITVSGHDVTAYNAEYVLTSVRHSFAADHHTFGGAYSNEYTAILTSGPPYLTPGAKSVSKGDHGIRLGLVTSNSATSTQHGPTDTAGTYLIQFPMETDQSGVVLEQVARLATPSAGPDRGFHFPLEVGDEVVVANHLGDPGRPIIIGALFHQTSAVSPPISTQDGKVLSRVLRSGKGAELRFDDDDNKSMVTLSSGTLDHSLVFDDTNKMTTLATKQDLTVNVTGNESVTVNKKLTVSVQSDSSLTVNGKSTYTAGDDYGFSGSGKVTAAATGDISMSGDGKTSVSSVGAIAISCDDKTSVTATGALSMTSDDSITLTSGSASIVIKSSGEITINGVKVTLTASDTLAQTGTSQVTIGGAQIAVSADAQLKLASSGPTAIKGAVIQLN
jgi:type VI secretion system secreted protein VgrG